MFEGRKKILACMGAFFAFMLICTLVSKGIYAAALAQVSVEQPRKMTVSHEVRADGNVVQSRELSVNAPAGLRVREVFVTPGQQVGEGDPLFLLDPDFLEDRIRDKELEIEKLNLQIRTLEHNEALAKQDKAREAQRAAEDAALTAAEWQTGVKRGIQDEAAANEELSGHLGSPAKVTSGEDRESREEDYTSYQDRVKGKTREQEEAASRVKALEERRAVLRAEIEALKKQLSGNTGPSVSANGAALGRASEALGPTAAQGTEVTEAATAAAKPTTEELKGLLASKEAELAGVETELAAAQKEQDRVKTELAALLGDAVTKPDFTAEDAAKKAWVEKEKGLKTQVTEAERQREDAQTEGVKKMTEAGRKVEDSLAPDESDSALGLCRLELLAAKRDLEEYLDMEKREGLVAAPMDGAVTRVGVSAGENTAEGAAVVFADTQRPLRFQVFLEKEDKRYVYQGAEASVTLVGGSVRPLRVAVDYLAELPDSPGVYSAAAVLPEGTGAIGQSGTFLLAGQSESYQNCIPADALYKDANGRSFVYVLRERQGFLGEELHAEKIMVEVEDSNERYAAISGETLGGEDEVICTSTKELSDGEVVRMRE